jgi:hypothetical protein
MAGIIVMSCGQGGNMVVFVKIDHKEYNVA